MLEDRESIPEPSSLDTVMNGSENRDAVAFLVEVGEVYPYQCDAAAGFGYGDRSRHDKSVSISG
jgi:hypothetical protein